MNDNKTSTTYWFGRLSNAIWYCVPIVVGFAIGLSYIQGKDLVIEARSSIEGYAIVIACIGLVGLQLITWLKKKRVAK